MQWRGARRSTNIEDRRGRGLGLVGGGIGGVVLLLLAAVLGLDPGESPPGGNSVDPATESGRPFTPSDDETAFVSAVVGLTEDTWAEVFGEAGETYTPPTLVLYTEAVRSACGLGQTAMGPFYCSLDQKIYLDMSFFDELQSRFGAPGDFAQAYVIAHEVGHHVQNLLGITQHAGLSNEASVRVELQADCFAGLWANRTEQGEQARLREFLESGDLDEALAAASSVGDDRIQLQQQGYVVPESFTHGTAAQRARWFRTGFETGTVGACDTFD